MNPATIFGEALHELRVALRSPLVPLLAAGMTGYLLLVLSNAQYMQEMGAADITRNSPHLVYLMTAGQGFWLLFAWAWLFSRVISRDREAKLDELVLAAPVHLPSLLLGRYLGVVVVASTLGLVSTVGFVFVGPMEAVGMLPAGSTGPIPLAAMMHAWLTLCLPSAVGMGALYVLAAIRTRNASGPFGVAAMLMLVWMVSMVILRSGEIDPSTATLLDPIAYGEVEAQANAWTPVEKMTGSIAFTPELLANRVLWCAVPLLALLWQIARLHRERLVLGAATRAGAADDHRTSRPPSTTNTAPVGPPSSPWWIRVLWAEAAWHTGQILRTWGLRIAAGLLLVMGVTGTVVHVVAHARGPLVPRPELLTAVLADFVYLVMVFVIAGFVGTMMRRDHQPGFDEIVGATPAPLWARLGGRALAAAALTFGLAMIPVVSGCIATALFASDSVSLTLPLTYGLLSFAPALLELSGVTILVHAWIRRPGLAHALTMVAAFIMVLNQELSLVVYPPGKLGVPAPVGFSELVGWGPWLPMLTTMAALKVSIFALAVALALLGWPRRTVVAGLERLRLAWSRLRGPAGAAIGAATLSVTALLFVLQQQFIDSGRYVEHAHELDEDAAWETRWLPHASRFWLDGGHLSVSLDPERGTVRSVWRIDGVRAEPGSLHMELPEGVEIERATVDGAEAQPDTSLGHAALPLGACADAGCTVELQIVATWRGWPADETAPWVHATGAWVRAQDVLPRLGVDPDRRLRAPRDRTAHQLPARAPFIEPQAAVSPIGAAPAGTWTLAFETPPGWTTHSSGERDGALDFAIAWRTEPPEHTTDGGVEIWHGRSHGATASEFLEDLDQMQRCLAEIAGLGNPVHTVLQAPRGHDPALAGGLLWLPEDRGWDVGAEGYGRSNRRFVIAQTIAGAALVDEARLRRQLGSRWVVHGVSGALALRCVRRAEGEEAWQSLMARRADDITNALGALVAPVEGLAADGDAEWVEQYAPAAVMAWTHQVGFDVAARDLNAFVSAVADGATVHDAFERISSIEPALTLLGPPLASDLSVEPESKVVGQRWRWANGGWTVEGPSSRFIVRRSGTLEKVSSGSTLDREAAVVLDDWPSFERSIDDNVWSGQPPEDDHE
ncbi:MAG: ABC transporter permease [Myxococcota bacterium]